MPAETKLFHVGSLGLIDGDDADAWEAFFADRDGYIARLRRMMRHVDIFKLSDEDLAWLYPDRPLETALADCRADCDAVLFILTLGADGSRVFLGDLEMTAAAPKLKDLADTVGVARSCSRTQHRIL